MKREERLRMKEREGIRRQQERKKIKKKKSQSPIGL
jgi:hypothetical protein